MRVRRLVDMRAFDDCFVVQVRVRDTRWCDAGRRVRNDPAHRGSVRDCRNGRGRAEECQEDDAEHVERRQERDDHQQHEWPGQSAGPHRAENLFLREEAAKEGDARERQRADDEDDRSLRHAAREAAHVRQVIAADSMNDCAGSEEEQCLEETVREEVQETG